MPKDKIEQVRSVVSEAAKLGYFLSVLAPLIAEGIQDTRRIDVLMHIVNRSKLKLACR